MSIAVAGPRRKLVLGTVMISMFMVAIETTIVATVMPGIVGELGGFAYYAWVFSAFMLAQTATTPLFGKLSDIFGRKPVLVGGILTFAFGSLLCGLATSMAALVAFRLVQGIGAGAMQPVAMTVVGDLFKLEERARAQAMIALVWATSAVIGPLAGALIVERLAWAWIFWINLPLCVLAIAGFVMFLDEKVAPRQARIDYAGAILFTIAIVALLLLLTEVEASWTIVATLGAITLVAGALFLRQEMRAEEPIISIALWSRPLIATSNAAVLLIGMALIGMTTILPLYVQGVLGRSPVIAGMTLTTLVLGWPLSVTLAGRLYKMFGVRNTARYGSLMLPLGALVLVLLTPESPPALAAVAAFLMGFGMGIVNTTGIILVQESVEWSMRGSATASIVFARSLGNTLGATALGAVLAIGIRHFGGPELAARLIALLNEPTGLSTLGAAPQARAVFYGAVHWCFIGVAAVAAAVVITTWLMPEVRRASAPAAEAKPAE